MWSQREAHGGSSEGRKREKVRVATTGVGCRNFGFKSRDHQSKVVENWKEIGGFVRERNTQYHRN